MYTDSGWGDYLATDGSSDLSVELSQAADVDQAAASTLADASTDLTDVDGDLPVDTAASDAARDASVNANLAGDSLDSASADQGRADWHGEIASDAVDSGNSHVEAANSALDTRTTDDTTSSTTTE